MPASSSSWKKALPNWLTYFRIGLIPVFVGLLSFPSDLNIRIALIIFVVAALTDAVDGYLARRWDAVTDLGKLLDPLADKILVMSALVMMVGMRGELYAEPWVPAWIVVLVLARELWVTGVRAVAAAKGVVVAAGRSGKWKSGLQMVAVVLLLLHDHTFTTIQGQIITCQLAGLNLLLVSVGFSYWGAVDYTARVLGRERPERA